MFMRKPRMILAIAIAMLAGAATAAPDPLSDLKAGEAALEAKRYPAAIATLKPLVQRLPDLADYAAWFWANAEFESQNYAAVPKALEAVARQNPPSPLEARAVLLAARAEVLGNRPHDALDRLRRAYESLSQPQADQAMADALAAAGDRAAAAGYYQRVYYGFPLSAQAAEAGEALAKLRTAMGNEYSSAAPDLMLSRETKLIDGGNPRRALAELESLIPRLSAADRDLARVAVGVAEYQAKETLRARATLKALEVTAPEADAERIYYLQLCARRLKNQEEADQAADQLARLYPNSKWRLEALLASAGHYLVENQMDAYEPLYRACYESFPHDPQAADCHWRVVWGHYLRRRADAGDLLRAHLRLFPASQEASAALYYLARLAESSHDAGAARVYYAEVVREYPNYYYAILARERLAKVDSAAPSSAAFDFLRSVAFPSRLRSLTFEPTAASKSRLERARKLVAVDLEDWAEGELRFGAQTGDQPQVLATELASLSAAHAGPDQAMRYIKHYAGGYLYMPLDSAPPQFWKLAFPIPFRADLERFSKQNGLDPFLVAALIRQESEFNPKVVSRSNARGLTQILPSTGRELSRRLKVRPYSTAKLFQPVVNMQLGTFYLKSLADNLGGNWEAALAAYNAGLSRAHAWLSWGEYREPAEFVETVPFEQTRTYIQTVLRNAEVYRRLYLADSSQPLPAIRH